MPWGGGCEDPGNRGFKVLRVDKMVGRMVWMDHGWTGALNRGCVDDMMMGAGRLGHLVGGKVVGCLLMVRVPRPASVAWYWRV